MDKRTFLKSQLWFVLALLFGGVATAADYANINSVRQGEFLFNTDTPNKYQVAPTISTRVLIDVTGPIARTKSDSVLVTRVINGLVGLMPSHYLKMQLLII